MLETLTAFPKLLQITLPVNTEIDGRNYPIKTIISTLSVNDETDGRHHPIKNNVTYHIASKLGLMSL